MSLKAFIPFGLILLLTNCQVSKNTHPTTSEKEVNITKIKFSRGACFGFCPIYTYTLVPHAESTFLAEAFNFSNKQPLQGKPEGEFKATLNPATWQEITRLVNQVKFDADTLRYNSPVTDVPAAHLDVWYSNGKHHYIYDYGMNGTQALKNLYQYMDRLKDNNEWGILATQ
ncbi:DUF6438 domain-containing protein [Vaginella massiliensis]|uniref:DUF6438 domain-containing protein n=1 Tax=Vaginella massiliensis TaxID=1816680 RepID=UPI0012B5A19A|nr:DUF6438 domain-containing protein [Vaginella massiliensis]